MRHEFNFSQICLNIRDRIPSVMTEHVSRTMGMRKYAVEAAPMLFAVRKAITTNDVIKILMVKYLTSSSKQSHQFGVEADTSTSQCKKSVELLQNQIKTRTFSEESFQHLKKLLAYVLYQNNDLRQRVLRVKLHIKSSGQGHTCPVAEICSNFPDLLKNQQTESLQGTELCDAIIDNYNLINDSMIKKIMAKIKTETDNTKMSAASATGTALVPQVIPVGKSARVILSARKIDRRVIKTTTTARSASRTDSLPKALSSELKIDRRIIKKSAGRASRAVSSARNTAAASSTITADRRTVRKTATSLTVSKFVSNRACPPVSGSKAKTSAGCSILKARMIKHATRNAATSAKSSVTPASSSVSPPSTVSASVSRVSWKLKPATFKYPIKPSVPLSVRPSAYQMPSGTQHPQTQSVCMPQSTFDPLKVVMATKYQGHTSMLGEQGMFNFTKLQAQQSEQREKSGRLAGHKRGAEGPEPPCSPPLKCRRVLEFTIPDYPPRMLKKPLLKVCPLTGQKRAARSLEFESVPPAKRPRLVKTRKQPKLRDVFLPALVRKSATLAGIKRHSEMVYDLSPPNKRRRLYKLSNLQSDWKDETPGRVD